MRDAEEMSSNQIPADISEYILYTGLVRGEKRHGFVVIGSPIVTTPGRSSLPPIIAPYLMLLSICGSCVEQSGYQGWYVARHRGRK